MSDNHAIEYLFSLSTLGWKLGLDTIREMLRELGNPQNRYRTIHVAGTNGKGSTCAMIESILRAAGYKTGLYTSPHLVYAGERIRCNGQAINKEELVAYIHLITPLIEKYRCTFFEALTAIAFRYFADQRVEIAVIEVGLGGRLDATNVIVPMLSIITDIDIDHKKQLGTTRRKIASEKAGIIKENSICLATCQSQQVNSLLAKICSERQTEFHCVRPEDNIENLRIGENNSIFDLRLNGITYSSIQLSLAGQHQIKNAALAITAAAILNDRFFPISVEVMAQGLASVSWPGRLQLISENPKIVIDVAHNPAGISVLTNAIRTLFHYQRLIVLFGVCKDKNYRSMIKQLAPLADLFITVQANNERSLSRITIARHAAAYVKDIYNALSITEGLNYAIRHAQPGDLILCTGSHYVLNDVVVYFNHARN